METIRIGNDINVTWKTFNRSGTGYSLEDKTLELWLISGPFKTMIKAYSFTESNAVSFTVDAGSITRYGIYKLLMRIYDGAGSMADSAYDLVQVFQIVSQSYPQKGSSVVNGAVDLEFTSVLNVVDLSLKGESAYDIACDHGFEGTEAEWLASLVGNPGRGITSVTSQETADHDVMVIFNFSDNTASQITIPIGQYFPTQEAQDTNE